VGVSGGGDRNERGKQGWAGILTGTVGGLDARVSYSVASFVFITVFRFSISFLSLNVTGDERGGRMAMSMEG